MQDMVYISQLKVDTIIGVYEFEKTQTQPLYFDITMHCDIALAAEQDDLSHTIDYAEVSRRVAEHCSIQPVELLETLVEQLAQMILREFATNQVTIRVSKPQAVPQAQTVGIEITRSKH